ncbi:MAG TPA: PRC-barrel domain-containing protein [Chloroflexia bacterium]|nr:PRC-barrel domain-containing protein [Chloroflexia bacterium]
MDKKASEIIGLPVVTFNTGRKIYDVEDLILDPERRQVLALVVEEKSAFHSAQAVPFGRINTIGPHAVIVPDGRAVIDVNRDSVLKGLYNDQVIKGLRVLSEDGRKLGEVSDLVLDSKTGEIRGFNVSIGKVLTVTQGARWIPMDRVINVGQRIVYIPTDLADEFEQQVGGLSGALEGAGEKARTAGAKLNEQLTQAGDKVRETLPLRAGALAVGKEAHETVNDAQGNAIVSKGEMVSQDHVERARQAGRLPQLLVATGRGPTQQNFGALGDQAGQSFQDIRTEARQLWGQLTGNYERTVDQADSKMMTRRIKNALGRPVTRVILDENDDVILNTGDIITNSAVQRARDADVLDILVDSVYTERPKFAPESLRFSGGRLTDEDNLDNEADTESQPRRARAANS